MKRIILAAAAVMVFGFTNAQKARFGVKGGLNISTIVGGDVEDTKSLVGFHVGGFAEIHVVQRFFIQPELLYSTQGSKFDGGPILGDADLKLDYLSIPVLAKYYIVDNKFSVEAGPQFGVLVSAKSDGEDVKDFTRSTDFGFNIGAGYNFTDNFSVGLRYTIGLSPISDQDIDDADDYYDSAKNSNLALSLAYKF